MYPLYFKSECLTQNPTHYPKGSTMRMIDQCHYETKKGFSIKTSDGMHWEARDPAGEYLDTIASLEEAMIYIDTAESYAD